MILENIISFIFDDQYGGFHPVNSISDKCLENIYKFLSRQLNELNKEISSSYLTSSILRGSAAIDCCDSGIATVEGIADELHSQLDKVKNEIAGRRQ